MGVLDGKVALVIGGTRGIGAAISRRMVADGASVGIIYRSRANDAQRFENELRENGARVFTVQADVSDVTALDHSMDQIARHFGGLDILVSVAGTAIVGPLEAYADDAFDRSFALNVRAPFVAAKKAASLMAKGGRIITIGSIVADRMPGGGGTLYAASKAALGGLTRGLARDLGAREITANLVQPGPIDTERNPAGRRLLSPVMEPLTRLQASSRTWLRRKPVSSRAPRTISMAAGVRNWPVLFKRLEPPIAHRPSHGAGISLRGPWHCRRDSSG
jgi:3-oxoacyl-[acyl-carrier protein] reductase